MRTLEETRSRWGATFANNDNLSDLRVAVRSGSSHNPCIDGLRSVCWKAFLVFENLDRSTWPKTIRDSRGAYGSLRDHFLRDMTHSESLSADPLADDENSPWNSLRRDELLQAEILQDVERCMPENSFFREPSTQKIMSDILFIFCKLNADVGYRQGMHEVLAPVLWVVSRDAIDTEGSQGDTKSCVLDELMVSVLDKNYIEHDSFTLFCLIMQTAKSFYETASNSQSSATRASENSPIVERSRRIHETYLRRADRELTEHLTSIDILPQIFVIRWIRLLFGREFPFKDVLSLWDVLFAEDPALDLVDLVCVAMLLRVRWELLEADYSSALTLLLRYPMPKAPHGPITFVEDALYLRNHLNSAGGAHLVSKYTGQSINSESTPGKSSLRRPPHTPQGSRDAGRQKSPLRSPSQVLGDAGGIENILQDAARGAFKQGEKWGLSLRGAIQQLQQANNSPRRSLGNMKWSLDHNKPIQSEPDIVKAKIKALEDRNKSLAKMLQDSIEELSVQARQFEEKKADTDANALTLTIAKLHFVHVYLDNSTMPLNPDSEEPDPKSSNSTDLMDNNNRKAPPPLNPSTVEEKPSSVEITGDQARHSSNSRISVSPTRSKPVRRRPPAVNKVKKEGDGESQANSQFQQSRPSLAESSYSWMLGEDRKKSSFVSASPFAPEDKRKNTPARAKSSFLFGEDSNDKPSKEREVDNADEDGFTLGTLKGGTK